VFVEPFAHPCHLGQKLSRGRQFYNNCSHDVLQPAMSGEGAAPGRGDISDTAPIWARCGTPARSNLIHGKRQ
jgi:hypothetical protein